MKGRGKERISSHNDLANWLFVLIIQTLNKRVWRIYKCKEIKDPEYPKRKLCGYIDGTQDENEIYLSANKQENPTKDDIGKTLLHEVLHIIYPMVKEGRILKLEAILWNSLSKQQRKIIKSYIPKHYSKK